MEIKSVHLQDVNISPKEVKVRSFSSLDISFSFNKLIPKGFFFGIRLRGGRNNKNDWYYLQPYDPTKKGFFKLNLGQNIELIPILITGKELVIKYLICEEKGFPANTKIEITITNTLVQSIIEEQKKIEIFIETPNNKQKLFPNSPELTVVNEEFDHATLISPSTVCTKKSFSLLIRLEDRFSNLVKNYNGKFDLYLKNENNNIAFRKELISNENNPGLFRLNDIIIPDQGIYHFEISNNKQVYQSNTIICRESNQGKNLFWGYIHGHTNKSDGIIDPENYFINLKNAGLDFGTTTEHDHSWETNDDDFEEIKQITRKHHEEGKFITFFGYEWGYWYTGYGDICIYYYDDTIPIYRSDVNKYNSSKKLIKALKAHEGKVLMIGHHSALRPGYRNWEFFDNSMERLVEIYSSWGNQEYSIKKGNPLAPRYKFFGYGKNATKRGPVLERTDSYVQSALIRGYKLGFTAGGDDHFGVYPSGSIDPDNGIYRTGIMAIWAEDLTKESIWNAMMNRKCYGTTGPRIIIEFFLNSHFMGDVINLAENESLIQRRTVRGKITGTLNPLKIELIRNNEVYKVIEGINNPTTINITDSDNFNDFSLKNPTNSEKFMFYYLRIFLPDNHMAWSSPIWITQSI